MFQKHPPKPNTEEILETSHSRSEKKSKSTSGTNVILSDVEIKGIVKFKNDVVIDGRIEGEIYSDGSVTIGPEATVEAEIRAKSVAVKGRVTGDIHASDRLELMENAEVTGDIRAAILSMEAGAILIGSSAVGAMPSADVVLSKPAWSEPDHAEEERELAHA